MRVLLAAALAGMLMLSGCVANPAVSSGSRDQSSSPATEPVSPADTWLITTRRPHSDSLSVELRLQQSQPSESAESTLGYVINVVSAGTGMREVAPGLALSASTSTGTVELWDGERSEYWAERVRDFGSGRTIQGALAALPPGARQVSLKVFIGPTDLEATQGFVIDVPVSNIPVVSEISRQYPYGYSPNF